MIKTILNKLYKRSTDVKPRLVKLGTLDDNRQFIEDVRADIEKRASDAIGDIYETELTIETIKILIENVDAAMNDMQAMEDKILDLGIDTPPEFNELWQMISDIQAFPDITDLGDKLQEVRLDLGKYIK